MLKLRHSIKTEHWSFNQSHTSDKQKKWCAEGSETTKLGYLCKRPGSTLDGKLGVTQLAVAGVGGGEPLLQAAFVHRAQGARTVTRGKEALSIAPLMAYPADGAITKRERALQNKDTQHRVVIVMSHSQL